jgi:hypothetical protein
MFGAVLLSLLTLIPVTFAGRSLGCKLYPDQADTIQRADEPIKIHGRDVWVSFPPGYTVVKPVSLILAFHDKGMSPQDLQSATLFSNPSVNNKAIVIYPSSRDVGYTIPFA